MSLYNTRGIYRIRNLVNGKMYIGFTNMNFGDRRDCHFACLRNNYHFNHDLQNDFNKYGESNFVFEVVEEIESDDILKYQEKEIYYISLYDTVNTGYNYTAGGNHSTRPTKEKIRQMAEINRIANTGKRISEETRKRMSISHRKRKDLSKPNILSEKDVIDIKNRLIGGEWLKVLADEYSVSVSCISCINKNKTWRNVIVPGWKEYVESQ